MRFYIRMPFLPLIPVWVVANQEGCTVEIRRATGPYEIGATLQLPKDRHTLIIEE